jgi:2-polyprenyl-6-hydroxyphenyl methylase/3-demethylubiquinone-9 3-methyltransferase
MAALTTGNNFQEEIKTGERFAFGENWSRFLRLLDEERIVQATNSLKAMLEVDDLKDKTFLDIGSGSGLFSLAAKRLGAKVYSFDYDPQSVACTMELKNRYFANDTEWQIQHGSVLDQDYLRGLGKFDITYSWGVLHHTGNMWQAMQNASDTVAPNGKLFIAIYNFQPFASSYWTFVKRTYNKYPLSRPLFVLAYSPLVMLTMLRNNLGNRKSARGMSVLYDFYDWVGGYPFEVSRPEQIFDYFKAKGYLLRKIKTVGGKMGCNEFVFQRQD